MVSLGDGQTGKSKTTCICARGRSSPGSVDFISYHDTNTEKLLLDNDVRLCDLDTQVLRWCGE